VAKLAGHAGRRQARRRRFSRKGRVSWSARRSQLPSSTGARNAPAFTNERNQPMDSAKMKIVYVITERNNRSFWNRVGVAFVNSDGSLNVKLEAVPVSGEMQIRDYVPRDDQPSPSAGLRRVRGNGASAALAEIA
jgi:hypothetical protein